MSLIILMCEINEKRYKNVDATLHYNFISYFAVLINRLIPGRHTVLFLYRMLNGKMNIQSISSVTDVEQARGQTGLSVN